MRIASRNVRLRPKNAFDLITLIARSQSDPRKALAELVQNSLDAGARSISVTRMRRRRQVAISILDDGQGIFPELERPEALERIATNVGHSFKRDLSPAERQREMQLGKYGIGLLGFWAVGEEMEMRSRVRGSEVWALRLVRDEPSAQVRKLTQGRIPFAKDTFTEVLIRGVDAGASRQLSGRRLGDYLASELRGQLLSRNVKLRMMDRVATGKALKDFLVVPQRFQGRRIGKLHEVPVPGYTPMRIELYLIDEQEERRGAVSLACGGTVVADDMASCAAYDVDGALWAGGRVEGIVDFLDLEVAPSTRRGFVPGAAADAFFEALKGVEAELREIIAADSERRRAEEEEDVAREIRKVFRPLARSLPQYDFFNIRRDSRSSPPASPEEEDGARLGKADAAPDAPPGEERVSEDVELGDDPEPPAELIPPGPLHQVRIVPRRSKLLPGASRELTAKAVDEGGRRLAPEDVEFTWTLLAGEAALEPRGPRLLFTAGVEPAVVRIGVTAMQGETSAAADAEIEVVEKLEGSDPDAGIPDPTKVFDAEGDWRSRVAGGQWEYNAAHPDYQVIADNAQRRLRYLVHLFSKEIVLRNYGEPKDERLLERMVEVLTHIRGRG